MSYELQGKIKLVDSIKDFDSGFRKREFVVTTEEKFPQDIKLEVVKDKCESLDDYNEGDEVRVKFNIRGNEYNGKYYVNLGAWWMDKIAATGVSDEVKAEAEEALNESTQDDEGSELPF